MYRKVESNNPVDWESLLESLDGDRELLEEIVSLFLEFGPAQVQDMKLAFEVQDPEAVASAAHRLKGSLGQFEARVGTRLAAELELQGQAGDISHSSELCSSLQEEVQSIIRSMEAWLEASS
jgi:two-component system, sensor histidine kinase and response regulator